MPLYVYRCQQGHETEELRKVEDREHLMACPVEGCGWSARPITTSPASIRFGVPGVKGHYKKSTTELP